MSAPHFRKKLVIIAFVLFALAILEFNFQHVAILGISFFNLIPFTITMVLTAFAAWLVVAAAEIDWIMFMLTLPVCMVLLLGVVIGEWLCYPFEETIQSCQTTAKTLKVKLIHRYDMSSEDVTGHSFFVIVERPLLPGLLTEQKNLLTVSAVSSAEINCTAGNIIKFRSPASQGRKEIIRFLTVDGGSK